MVEEVSFYGLNNDDSDDNRDLDTLAAYASVHSRTGKQVYLLI